jgi:hypothetical protein
MADLVEQLLSRPGLYVGSQTRPDEPNAPAAVARIDVSALPGASGVMLTYEVLRESGEITHREHALVAHASRGIILVTSHTHAGVTTVVPEAEPGWFPAAEGTAPFPMAIRIEIPEPSRLIYSWSYGGNGQPLIVRDVGDTRAID